MAIIATVWKVENIRSSATGRLTYATTDLHLGCVGGIHKKVEQPTREIVHSYCIVSLVTYITMVSLWSCCGDAVESGPCIGSNASSGEHRMERHADGGARVLWTRNHQSSGESWCGWSPSGAGSAYKDGTVFTLCMLVSHDSSHLFSFLLLLSFLPIPPHREPPHTSYR